jgi:hypothetical protein
MLAQAKETPAVLDEANETFDLMIGDLEIEVPELLEPNPTCSLHYYCS